MNDEGYRHQTQQFLGAILHPAASVQRHLECFISMPGKDGGKAKPLKAPAKKSKDYDDDDKAFLAKKKEEEAALKKAKEAMLKGKKK